MRAVEADHAAYRLRKPGLNKEAMLEVRSCGRSHDIESFIAFRDVIVQRVRVDLLKSDLHETLLSGVKREYGAQVVTVLDAIMAWLRPVDRRSLPLLRLRTTLFQCLDQLPGEQQLIAALLPFCDDRFAADLFCFAAELDHLKHSSGIGALLTEFRDHPDEVLLARLRMTGLELFALTEDTALLLTQC